MTWLANGARDWRVWILVLLLQAPALRVFAKYLPLPLRPLIPIWFLATLILYAGLLHDSRARAWCRRLWSLARLAIVVVLLASVNAVVYPRVDALKSQMRGSDEDDALIQTGVRMITGKRPVYVPTYLGNSPSPGPGWALMVAPLAMSGTYFLLTPIAIGLFPLALLHAGAGELAAALAVVLPLSSPMFWELLVSGSDAVAIGVLFVGLTTTVFCWRDRRVATGAACTALMIAAGSSRVIFAYPAALVGGFMWKRDRAGAAFLVGVILALVALECALWLPDPEATPMHLLDKGMNLLGPAGMLAGAAASLIAAGVALARIDDRVASWLQGAWLGLAVPVVAVSVADLVSAGWDVAHWQGATYLMTAMPLFVSYAVSERQQR